MLLFYERGPNVLWSLTIPFFFFRWAFAFNNNNKSLTNRFKKTLISSLHVWTGASCAEGVISLLPLDGAVCFLKTQLKPHNFQCSLSQLDKDQETESEKSSAAEDASESESTQVLKTPCALIRQLHCFFVFFCTTVHYRDLLY